VRRPNQQFGAQHEHAEADHEEDERQHTLDLARLSDMLRSFADHRPMLTALLH
jgi:hypothetical protein